MARCLEGAHGTGSARPLRSMSRVVTLTDSGDLQFQGHTPLRLKKQHWTNEGWRRIGRSGRAGMNALVGASSGGPAMLVAAAFPSSLRPRFAEPLGCSSCFVRIGQAPGTARTCNPQIRSLALNTTASGFAC